MKTAILLLLLLPGCAFYRGIDSGTRTAYLVSASETGDPPPPPYQTTIQVSKDAASPVQRAALAPPQMVSFTCQFKPGQSDGEHVYIGKQVGVFSQMLTFPVTNQFSLPLDTNTPTYVEARSFTNLAKPSVITWTNGDGSIGSQTNTFQEMAGVGLVYVPTNCQSIALMPFTNGLQLVGWGASGTVYQIQSSTDLILWSSNATVMGTNGPYQVRMNSSQPQTFWRTAW